MYSSLNAQHENQAEITKGQLISKAKCQAVDSPKKRTNEFALFDLKTTFTSFIGLIWVQIPDPELMMKVGEM